MAGIVRTREYFTARFVPGYVLTDQDMADILASYRHIQQDPVLVDWTSTAVYRTGQLVRRPDGSVWRANEYVTPGSWTPAKFTQIVGPQGLAGNAFSEYSALNSYQSGDTVRHTDRLWRAIQAVPQGEAPPTDPGTGSNTYWVAVSEPQGVFIDDYAAGVHVVGQIFTYAGSLYRVERMGYTRGEVIYTPENSPIDAGYPCISGTRLRNADGSIDSITDPLEFTGAVTRNGEVINITPRIIVTDRQDVATLINNFDPDFPDTGLIPGKYFINDALGGTAQILVEAISGNELCPDTAYNLTTAEHGTYNGVDDTWTTAGAASVSYVNTRTKRLVLVIEPSGISAVLYNGTDVSNGDLGFNAIGTGHYEITGLPSTDLYIMTTTSTSASYQPIQFQQASPGSSQFYAYETDSPFGLSNSWDAITLIIDCYPD